VTSITTSQGWTCQLMMGTPFAAVNVDGSPKPPDRPSIDNEGRSGPAGRLNVERLGNGRVSRMRRAGGTI